MKKLRFICMAFLFFWLLPHSAPAQTVDDYIALIDGCRTGDLGQVKAALNAGIEIDTPDKDGLTPLMHALDAGQGDVAKYLVKLGADLTLRNRFFEAPLNLAIRSTDLDTVKYLLDSGAPISGNGTSPVRTALEWGTSDSLKALTRHGARIVDWHDDSESSSTVAARHNNLEAIELLLNLGANINHPDPDGNYPLGVACLHGHTEMASFLLKRDADPNAINQGALKITRVRRFPHTALIAAVRANDAEIVKLLLEAGANPTLMDNQAILQADLAGNQVIYDMLLAKGASKPYPYQFMEIPEIKENMKANEFRELRKEPTVKVTSDWGLLSIINKHEHNIDIEPTFPENCSFSVATITKDETSEPVGLLLTSQLSSVEGIRVIERQDITKALKEQNLSAISGDHPEQSIASGKLLGADCLIVLICDEKLQKAKIISTATGLVLETLVASSEKNPEEWAKTIFNAMARNSGPLMLPPEKRILVSIPRITAIEERTSRLDLSKSLSGALSFHLGSLENVYVLERQELNRLVMEKTLTKDLTDFYSSGWLLDGHYNISGGDLLELKLRLRKGRQGQEKVISVSGPLSDPQKILADATSHIASMLQAAPSSNWSATEEASTFSSDAKLAFNANLWEVAQHNADAAWYMGNTSDEITDMRVRSRVHRIRTARWLNIQPHISNRGLDRGVNLLDSRSPLLRVPRDSRELNAMHYLQLSGDLLDIYEPVLEKESLSKYELDLLMFYPEVLKAATTPLHFLDTISDMTLYVSDLNPLRQRLLKITRRALTVAKENNYSYLYQAILNSYVHHLPYWINDEDKLYGEIHRRCREAASMRAPYSKHTFFNALERIMIRQTNNFGGKAGTSWQRLAEKMIKSDVSDERLLGLHTTRRHTEDYRAKLRYTGELFKLTQEVLKADQSLLGITDSYRMELDEKLTIRNTFRKLPEYGLGVWYPDPLDFRLGRAMNTFGPARRYWNPSTKYSSAAPGGFSRRTLKDYQIPLVLLMDTRLDAMLQHGALACDINEPERFQGVPSRQLSDLADKAESALERAKQTHKDKTYLDNTLVRFNSYVIKRIHNLIPKAESSADFADADSKPNNANPPTSSIPTKPLGHNRIFHVMKYPGWDAEKGVKFLLHRLTTMGSLLLLADENFGFYVYDPDEDSIVDSFFCPDGGHFASESFYVDEHNLVVYFFAFERQRASKIGFFDRKNKKWTLYEPEKINANGYHRNAISKVLLLENYLYYSFLIHPDPHGLLWREIIKDSKTSKGIARINLKSSKEELLVSNRRTPAETPIDQANCNVYDLNLVSDHQFSSCGYTFDEKTGQWSKTKSENINKPDRRLYIELQAKKYFLTTSQYDLSVPSIVTNLYNVETNTKAIPEKISLPLDVSSFKKLKLTERAKRDVNSFDKNSGKPIFRVELLSSGLLLHNRIGFMFIPKEELEAHLNVLEWGQ